MKNQIILIILLFQLFKINSITPASDAVIKSYKSLDWICTTSVPQMCLKNKIVTPMDFKTTLEVCTNKIMWDVDFVGDGLSLFTLMVTKSEMKKCSDFFKSFLLTQLVTNDYDKYISSLVTPRDDSNDFTKMISKMNVDFSFNNVGKLGLLSASYDVMPTVHGFIGESICGNMDLKSWSLMEADCKFSTCGSVHLGLDGDLNLHRDYSGESTSISVSVGVITVGLSFSISDNKLVLRKPTIQVCWDVWSLNWFKMIKEFVNSSKIGTILKKLITLIFENKSKIEAISTVSDQKKMLMDILKMTNGGANVCKARLYVPKDLIIERSNKILNAGDELKDTVIDLMKLAMRLIKSETAFRKIKPNRNKNIEMTA